MCPPVSQDPDTPDFDNFTITITDFDPVFVTDSQYQQPISVEKDYSITITINNIIGPSDSTTVMFGKCILVLENSKVLSFYTCTLLYLQFYYFT